MKSCIFIVGLVITLGCCSAQTFSSLGKGFNGEPRGIVYNNIDGLLYVGGNFSNIRDGITVHGVAKWDGTDWDSLGSGVNDGGLVYCMEKFNNYILAGGSFASIGGINSKGLAYWDGINWNNFSDLSTSAGYGGVLGLYIHNTELYAMGNFDSVNGVPANKIAKFDGSIWTGFPFIDPNGYVGTSIIYNNELYIGGNFNGGVGLKDIAKFDGLNWVSVGGGLSGGNTWVNCFAIYQGQLYIGGYFQSANGDPGNNIAIWDGNNWSQPSNGVQPSNVFAMTEFQQDLYVAGQINNASGVAVTGIAKWNGIQWSGLNALFSNSSNCFEISNNDLYIGGGFLTINGDTMAGITKFNLPVSIENVENSHPGITINYDEHQQIIYINFANKELTIFEFNLFDLFGRIIGEQMLIEKLNAKEYKIHIAKLNVGHYFVKVNTNYGIFMQKICIR